MVGIPLRIEPLGVDAAEVEGDIPASEWERIRAPRLEGDIAFSPISADWSVTIDHAHENCFASKAVVRHRDDGVGVHECTLARTPLTGARSIRPCFPPWARRVRARAAHRQASSG